MTDSRESRYVPTVLCTRLGKLCINGALGFDSYLVMRYGVADMGCYFCNDVVGVADSVTARTLDQECTVTRPGMALQCAAQCVELFVQIVQNGHGHSEAAVHANKDQDGNYIGVMGTVPHTIRYYQRYQ